MVTTTGDRDRAKRDLRVAVRLPADARAAALLADRVGPDDAGDSRRLRRQRAAARHHRVPRRLLLSGGARRSRRRAAPARGAQRRVSGRAPARAAADLRAALHAAGRPLGQHRAPQPGAGRRSRSVHRDARTAGLDGDGDAAGADQAAAPAADDLRQLRPRRLAPDGRSAGSVHRQPGDPPAAAHRRRADRPVPRGQSVRRALLSQQRDARRR